jgi:hypothetical protein
MNKEERAEFNMAVENAYDEVLMAEEKRGISYGECAYIEGLSDEEARELLEECYEKLNELEGE